MTEPQRQDLKGITGVHLSRLLPLGFSNQRQPIDALIRRLAKQDGAAWLKSRLESGPLAAPGSMEEQLAAGRASLPELVELKKRADALLEAPERRDDFLCGMAGYFLAIAAALVHHGKLISSQKPEKLRPVLARLAAAAPEPWRALLEKAASR